MPPKRTAAKKSPAKKAAPKKTIAKKSPVGSDTHMHSVQRAQNLF